MCHEGRIEIARREKMGFDDFLEVAKQLINELDMKLMCSEENEEYLNYIINGSWPDADEIIRDRREKLKQPHTKEEFEEEQKYSRWEMKIIRNGEDVWVPAERLGNGTFIEKVKK